jgi:hypothetical protein
MDGLWRRQMSGRTNPLRQLPPGCVLAERWKRFDSPSERCRNSQGNCAIPKLVRPFQKFVQLVTNVLSQNPTDTLKQQKFGPVTTSAQTEALTE